MALLEFAELLVPRALVRSELHGFLRMKVQVRHVFVAGFTLNLQLGIEFLQTFAEGIHTEYATYYECSTCRHLRRTFKDFGKCLIHTFGNTALLIHAHWAQVSTASFGICPDNSQPLAHIFAQRSKFTCLMCLFKHFHHTDILLVRNQPARAMTSEVTDIERLVTLRCLGLYTRCRIGIIHSSGNGNVIEDFFARGLCIRRCMHSRCGKKNGRKNGSFQSKIHRIIKLFSSRNQDFVSN